MFFVNFERNQGSWKQIVDPDAIIKMLCPFASPDKCGSQDKDRAFFVQALNWNTSSSLLESCPLFHSPSNCMVVSWARIDNGEELVRSLGMTPSSLKELSDSELILHSYLKWGEECVNYLIGDFVFAIYDGKKDSLFCARDHMGVRPFYYYLSPERLVCATSLAALIYPDFVPAETDEQWICEYLCRLSMSWDRTPYKGIHKLPPAHSLSVTANNHQLRQYFQLSSVEELHFKDSRQYVEIYREELEKAIRCRLRTHYALGYDLSGGLDSSTIAAYTARFFNQPETKLHAFSIATYELDSPYIEEVIRTCRLSQAHLITSRDCQSMDDVSGRLAIILGHPVENGVNVIQEAFFRKEEDLGIRAHLSGFGGDDFVTSIHGHLVPHELLEKRRYKELWNILPGNAFFRFLRLIKMRLQEIQAVHRTGDLYSPRFYEPLSLYQKNFLVRQHFVDRFNLKKRFLDKARYDAGYTHLKRFTLEKRWLPFIPTRMSEANLAAAARKIECRWPLLDLRLVKLFMSIPSTEHYYRGMGRYLHRRAVDGIVPKAVTWKPNKNMGPFIGQDFFETDDLLQFSTSNLHPALTEYIDMEKLHRQIEEFRSMHKAGVKLNKRILIIRNIHAITYLNTWLKYDENIPRSLFLKAEEQKSSTG